MDLDEPLILDGMRSWAGSQRAYGGASVSGSRRLVRTGWYGTETDEHEGAFCMVAQGSALEDLTGEIVRVGADGRSILVYCLGAASLPTELALARPAFLRLAMLSDETVMATVSS